MNRTLILFAGFGGTTSLILFDSAIKGAILLLFAGGVVFLLRRDSAATRHLVWLVAIIAMLAVPALSALLPQLRILPRWATVADATGRTPIHDLRVESPSHSTKAPLSDLPPLDPVVVNATGDQLQPLDPIQESPLPPDDDVEIFVPAVQVSPAAEGQRLNWNWNIAIVVIWQVGVIALILRLIAARLMLWRTELSCVVVNVDPDRIEQSNRSLASAPAADAIAANFVSACTTLNIRQSVRLLVHPNKTIPIVWGVFRPRLMLPLSAKQWSEDKLRSVLLHELAHIKRRDTVGQLLGQSACVLHWFNPLVWFANWRLHIERERACDDLVLASGVRASSYAGHLLDVATNQTTSPWTQACGLAMARNSSLHGRLSAVLSEKQNRRSVTTAILIASLVLSLCISIPLAMLQAAEDQIPISGNVTESAPVQKVPLKPWAYQGVDSALLRRWQQLEGPANTIPESRLATLRSAIGRFIDSIDNSPFTVKPEQLAELKSLQVLDKEKQLHSPQEAAKYINAVFAIHGEPVQMAFNEAPWPGTPLKDEDAQRLAFGPAAANGLRVALRCEKDQFIFGDTARLDLTYWNSGTETLLVGIGRDAPGLYPKLIFHAVGKDGRTLETTASDETEMLSSIKFTKLWQLRPGESVDVFGYRLRVGSAEPRENEGWPQWYTVVSIPDAVDGETIRLSASMPYPYAPGEAAQSVPFQTGIVTVKATAPESVLVWSPARSGSWPMPGGANLKLTQEVFHGADVITNIVLTWPVDQSGTTYGHTINVAGDAFGNREPWDVAWERNSNVIWMMNGESSFLGSNSHPQANRVRRIDLSDKMKITTTTWYHQPRSMPEAIRAKFEKSFDPLPSQPRRASEADGVQRVDEAHDVRPIAELLNGVWQNKGGDIDAKVTIPNAETGEIEWTIGFKHETGVSVVTATLSRIIAPADNAISLYVKSGLGVPFSGDEVLGRLRRGPDNTLLLD
ncbi:MAG: M56 family metallopeptidase, partial [Planctomycetales bacterium]|nr:M56 family metallopeptidase [Planctomycetales bacterium]